ncbi:MAG: hypothetical protein IJ760_08355 [Bacteroidales bacterium]|nr:hypothetical protein [Bacteroidales bacterium]
MDIKLHLRKFLGNVVLMVVIIVVVNLVNHYAIIAKLVLFDALIILVVAAVWTPISIRFGQYLDRMQK